MGNVESGGKLIAVGNIIVMGSVKGEVEAGCMGNHDAYIAALDLSPTKIKIADTVFEPEKYTENEDNSPRKAYLINNEIKIEKFW
jgi:septum site-determining protein MinC